MLNSMNVRAAERSELDQLARIWYDGWQDAHVALMPAELTRLRTVERFRDRLEAALPDIRVVGAVGTPAGFSIIKADELYQIFVSKEARGTGVAVALMDEAEARLARNGVRTAWLACAVGNERAARFYQKRGWQLAGTVTYHAETQDGPFPLNVCRYEKTL